MLLAVSSLKIYYALGVSVDYSYREVLKHLDSECLPSISIVEIVIAGASLIMLLVNKPCS